MLFTLRGLRSSLLSYKVQKHMVKILTVFLCLVLVFSCLVPSAPRAHAIVITAGTVAVVMAVAAAAGITITAASGTDLVSYLSAKIDAWGFPSWIEQIVFGGNLRLTQEQAQEVGEFLDSMATEPELGVVYHSGNYTNYFTVDGFPVTYGTSVTGYYPQWELPCWNFPQEVASAVYYPIASMPEFKITFVPVSGSNRASYAFWYNDTQFSTGVFYSSDDVTGIDHYFSFKTSDNSLKVRRNNASISAPAEMASQMASLLGLGGLTIDYADYTDIVSGILPGEELVISTGAATADDFLAAAAAGTAVVTSEVVAEAGTGEVTDPTSSYDSMQLPVLSDKFPFCIPFDLVALVGALNATSEAPVFEIPIDFSFAGYEDTVIIDLSAWEPVAAAVRWGMTLLWILGLIMISRKLIGG